MSEFQLYLFGLIIRMCAALQSTFDNVVNQIISMDSFTVLQVIVIRSWKFGEAGVRFYTYLLGKLHLPWRETTENVKMNAIFEYVPMTIYNIHLFNW